MLKIFSCIKRKIQKKSIKCQYLMHTQLSQRNKQKGQVLLEYILLISIVILIARALMEGLVLRSPGNQGVVIKSWMEVSEIIAADEPD